LIEASRGQDGPPGQEQGHRRRGHQAASQVVEDLEADLVVVCKLHVVRGAAFGIGKHRVGLDHLTEQFVIAGFFVVWVIALRQDVEHAPDGIGIGAPAHLQDFVTVQVIGVLVRGFLPGRFFGRHLRKQLRVVFSDPRQSAGANPELAENRLGACLGLDLAELPRGLEHTAQRRQHAVDGALTVDRDERRAETCE
jgi:hypothetical protein